MKNSTSEVIKYLEQYVGQEVIRTAPACGDWSYTSGEPLLLLGFTSDGCIKYRHTGIYAKFFGDAEYVLSIHFTDLNWISLLKTSYS